MKFVIVVISIRILSAKANCWASIMKSNRTVLASECVAFITIEM